MFGVRGQNGGRPAAGRSLGRRHGNSAAVEHGFGSVVFLGDDARGIRPQTRDRCTISIEGAARPAIPSRRPWLALIVIDEYLDAATRPSGDAGRDGEQQKE